MSEGVVFSFWCITVLTYISLHYFVQEALLG